MCATFPVNLSIAHVARLMRVNWYRDGASRLSVYVVIVVYTACYAACVAVCIIHNSLKLVASSIRSVVMSSCPRASSGSVRGHSGGHEALRHTQLLIVTPCAECYAC